MIALLLAAALTLPGWSAECEAKYVRECLQRGDDPACTVECEAGQSAGEPEGMPPVDDEEAETPVVCHLTARVYRNLLSQPLAYLYVQYMSDACGDDPPRYECDTATVTSLREDEIDLFCDDADCYRTFGAMVAGPTGRHVVRVYAGDEGFAEITVKLRGFVERSKLAGQ